jgi:hypothetical protein
MSTSTLFSDSFLRNVEEKSDRIVLEKKILFDEGHRRIAFRPAQISIHNLRQKRKKSKK